MRSEEIDGGSTFADHDLRYLEEVPAIIGIDEAGRGPLAGPVSAAAVHLDKTFFDSNWFFEYAKEVNDSKQLSEAARERIFDAIGKADAGLISSACCMLPVKEIEKLNILGATRRAMAICVAKLMKDPVCRFDSVYEGSDWLFRAVSNEGVGRILVDGKPLKPFRYSHTAIVKGDGKSMAIALASIIAKVTRDRYMRRQAKRYPEYGFESHKGYGTAKHVAVLKEIGPCKLHRMSFLSQILK